MLYFSYRPLSSTAELIDGQIYDAAPPTRKHQRIVGEMFATIRVYTLDSISTFQPCIYKSCNGFYVYAKRKELRNSLYFDSHFTYSVTTSLVLLK